MTFGIGLSSSLRALAAARLAIQTAAQNVANANTPGYSRQRVLLSATRPFPVGAGLFVGSGVQVTDVRRVVDEGLLLRINAQTSLFARAEARQGRLAEIEGLFVSGDGGVAERLSGFFGSLGQLQTDPSDRALRGGVVQAARSFAETLNSVGQRLRTLSDATFDEVRGLARAVDQKTAQIAVLNTDIVRLEASGGRADDLRDRRDQLVREVAEQLEVRTREHANGSLDLIAGGRLLVAGGRSHELAVGRDASGRTELRVHGGTLRVDGGRIGALLEFEAEGGPVVASRADALARSIALQFNRIHSTGIPASGPFRELVAHNGANDTNGNGRLGDELLRDLGLPFAVTEGTLWVRVTDDATGEANRTAVRIDPASMTLEELATELSRIEHLSAAVDATGRLRIRADQGHGFDFAGVLDATPDAFGAFGGARPTLATQSAGPFDLGGSFPLTFDVTVGGTTETVTLDADDFLVPGAATAEEIAAAIGEDLTIGTATSVGGRVVIRGNASGASATLSLTDGAGAPLAALGMALGPATGQDRGVVATISGDYTGKVNDLYTFVAAGDGEIGVTPGLQVHVLDGNGQRVATLDVGAGYDGQPLEVAHGVEVAFSAGQVSASTNQAFALDVLADPDTSDVLASLGLNTLFTGSTASDLRVADSIASNVDLFAAGTRSEDGDAGNLLRMLQLEHTGLDALGGSDFEAYLGEVIAEIGFESAAATATLETQESLSAALEQQRLSISGVDIDEEMLDITAWQQTYEAASRVVAIVQDMTATLMSMGRIR